MKVIYKYPVNGMPNTCIRIMTPMGAFKPLCVQMQHGKPQLWAEVDLDGLRDPQPNVMREVHTAGTGDFVPHHLTYAGTVQLDGGNLVLHVYADCRESK